MCSLLFWLQKKRCCQPHLEGYSSFLLTRCSFHSIFLFYYNPVPLVVIFHFHSYITTWTCPDNFDPWKERISFCILYKGVLSLYGERWHRQRKKLKTDSMAESGALRLRRSSRSIVHSCCAVDWDSIPMNPQNLRLSSFWTYPGRKTVVGRENWKGCYWATREKSIPCNSSANQEVLFSALKLWES